MTDDDQKKIEWLMKPLRQLLECEVFKIRNTDDSTNWIIAIHFSEPRGDGQWQKFNCRGPLNKRFLAWAEEQCLYWVDRAHVPINVREITYVSGGIAYPSW
ncbi:MAG: hypothetical protein U1A25_00305 [Candidatus Sungbacteria bacterium]|nr:hypothetical protein [bacterium]MDZ4260085.1 hypothetical protein [Candidatus Sungbacteria bacterium]